MQGRIQHLVSVATETEARLAPVLNWNPNPGDCLSIPCRVDLKKLRSALFCLSTTADRIIDRLISLEQKILSHEAEQFANKKILEDQILTTRATEFLTKLQEAASEFGVESFSNLMEMEAIPKEVE